MAFMRWKTLYRCRESGLISEDFVSLLPKRLRLDPNFVTRHFQRPETRQRTFTTIFKDYNTLFKEVIIVPADEAITPGMRSVFDAKIGSCKMNKEQLFTALKQKLRDIVFLNWKTDYSHAILHSSGLDSKMLSWTIRSLYQKYGNRWLGSVLFLCSKFEGSEFKKIMSYEDWKESQFLIVDEDVEDTEYFADSLLDFENAWQEVGGPGAMDYPTNVFWYLPKRAKSKGLLPEHFQLWTGYWGTAVIIAASEPEGGKGVEKDFKTWYPSLLLARSYKGDEVIMPFTDEDYVRLIVESSLRLGAEIRPQLLASMDKHLAQFLNMNEPHVRPKRIANWILEHILKDYRKSWYGRKVHPEAIWEKPTDDFQLFWGHWSAASLCEYLLENTYKIEVAA